MNLAFFSHDSHQTSSAPRTASCPAPNGTTISVSGTTQTVAYTACGLRSPLYSLRRAPSRYPARSVPSQEPGTAKIPRCERRAFTDWYAVRVSFLHTSCEVPTRQTTPPPRRCRMATTTNIDNDIVQVTSRDAQRLLAGATVDIDVADSTRRRPNESKSRAT